MKISQSWLILAHLHFNRMLNNHYCVCVCVGVCVCMIFFILPGNILTSDCRYLPLEHLYFNYR